MIRRRQGRIINMSSVAGRIAYPLRAPYAAAKWGVIGLTETLAQEPGAWNVQVNAVCPGPVEGTPRVESMIARRAHALKVPGHEVRRQFTRCAALGRMVKAADVSHVVLFPCSEAGENITGHAIEASAGFGLWPG